MAGVKGKIRLSAFLAALAALCLVAAFLLGSLFFFAGFQPFYEGEFEKLGIHESTGMDEATLSGVTRSLIAYLFGRGDLAAVEGQVHGENRQIFNQKEIEHMVDVQVLFRSALLALVIAGAAFIVLAAAAVAAAPKKRKVYSISKGALIITAPLFALIAAGAAYVWFNFDRVFLLFHEVFFAADAELKWLLDPSTDILIQIVPQQFFVDIAFAIFGTFLGLLLLVMILSIVGVMRGRRRARDMDADEYYDSEPEEYELSGVNYLANAPVNTVSEDNVKTIPMPDVSEPRPKAEEIFRSMGITDSSSVPPQVRSLIENRPVAVPATPAEAPVHEESTQKPDDEPPSAEELLGRLSRL